MLLLDITPPVQVESHRVPYFRYFGPTAIVPGYKAMVVAVPSRDRRSNVPTPARRSIQFRVSITSLGDFHTKASLRFARQSYSGYPFDCKCFVFCASQRFLEDVKFLLSPNICGPVSIVKFVAFFFGNYQDSSIV